MTSWRDSGATAMLIGRLCAVSRSLHASLGSQALTVTDPRLVVFLDEISMLHAHHAAVLLEHLPKRDGVDRESLIDSGAMGRVIDLAASSGPEALIDLYRTEVLGRLAASTSDLHQGCSVAAERNLRRSLDAMIRDLAEIAERLSEVADTTPREISSGSLGDQVAGALSTLDEGVFNS